jgi:hypothetical protein
MSKRDTDMRDDDALEALFQRARSAPPPVPAALMARVLADAQAAQPAPAQGIWRVLWHSIGRSAGLGGLATATLVGVWIGVAPPERIPDIGAEIIVGDYIAADTSTDLQQEYLSDGTAFGWDIEEG